MAELTGNGDPRPVAGDPRAVRVRLDPESHPGDVHSVRVAPVTGPLQMTNPTVGRGAFGGVAIVPEGNLPARVSAQRQFLVDDIASGATIRSQGGGRYLLEAESGITRVAIGAVSVVVGGIRRHEVLVDGFRFVVDVESERIAALRERASQGRASSAHAGPLQVKAIIPGKVVAVSVKTGDAVTAGQQLLVVEAMKMQNELRAPRDGTIERVGVAVGVNIEIGDLLVVIS
jgi:biotin carboxyl carrier protein